MTEKENLHIYFERLELPDDAGLEEIRKAYSNLKGLYAEGSIAFDPLADEMSSEERRRIVAEIEEAYRVLAEHFEQKKQDMQWAAGKQASGNGAGKHEHAEPQHFDGPGLKSMRENLGINLKEIEHHTKIRSIYLEAIEEENYDKLPGEVFLRGYIRKYAEFMGLDPDRVLSDYIAKQKRS